MKRRDFLKGTLVTAGAVMMNPMGCGTAEETVLVRADGHEFFPQSVASGDPKPDSVILWTRTWNAADLTGDHTVTLEVSQDEAFAELVALDGTANFVLSAQADNDHCVKVNLRGLAAGTFYYYRFLYNDGSTLHLSRTGRTKTAPAADSNAKVRFAFTSCQDYNGHYFNTYRRLNQLDDVDFVVHLGDYVYETTGNPSFQDAIDGRRVEFTEPAGAVVFNEGTEEEFQSAVTLSQYRDLYQIYRSDPDLQACHEKYPFIAVWDDHEFSDDCHGATSTMFAGREDELDPERRQTANRAWFEYMPVDYLNKPAFAYDPTVAFPDDITIWRDFSFGKHCHLVMTDLRSRRGDHPVAEDAFPGAVAVTEADMKDHLGDVSEFARPYVDIEIYGDGDYKTGLAAYAQAGGYLATDVQGLISADWINGQLADGAGGGSLTAIDTSDSSLALGIAYTDLGKRDRYSSLGSRYLTIKDAYDVFCAVGYAKDKGSQTIMGEPQRTWFMDTMKASKATWKVWGNEYMLMPQIVDMTAATTLPPAFKQRFYINSEDWTACPDRRDEVVAELGGLENVVAITGDIHAFFAGVPSPRTDPSKSIVEFVTAGIASNSLRTLLLRTAQADPTLAAANAPVLAYGIKTFLTEPKIKPNPHLAHADVAVQGFAICELDGSELNTWFHGIEEHHLGTDLGAELEDKFVVSRFKVETGKKALHMEIDGAFKRWDPTTSTYV